MRRALLSVTGAGLLMVVGIAPAIASDVNCGIVMKSVKMGRSPQDIADIGIGPLEDLLRNHGPALLERTEQLARADPQFRRALHGINTR